MSENIDDVSKFLTTARLREIDLLPYHRFGSDKYRRLHLPYGMEGVAPAHGRANGPSGRAPEARRVHGADWRMT